MQHRDAAALTSRSAPAPASPARPNLSPGQDCSLIGTPYAMTLFPFRPYFLKFAKRFTVRVDGIKPEGPWSAYMKHVQERRRNPFVKQTCAARFRADALGRWWKLSDTKYCRNETSRRNYDHKVQR